jgi:hypothetical protein
MLLSSSRFFGGFAGEREKSHGFIHTKIPVTREKVPASGKSFYLFSGVSEKAFSSVFIHRNKGVNPFSPREKHLPMFIHITQ